MPPATEPPIRLKPGPFQRPDYFTTDVAKGVTRTPGGTRICTLTGDFLLGLRDALVYECGKSHRQVMKQVGRRWGTQFAKWFERELTTSYGTPLKSLHESAVRAALADAFSAHGYGRLILQKVGGGTVTVAVLRDGVIPGLVRESEGPADYLTAGFLAAVLGHLAGRDLDCVQTECPSRGADAARFVAADPARLAGAEDRLAADPPASHADIVERACSGGERP